MELTQDLPPQYEERMLAAKLDCDRGNGQGDACHAVGEFLSVVKNDHAGARQQQEEVDPLLLPPVGAKPDTHCD